MTAENDVAGKDQPQFGRRELTQHAWIRVGRQQRLPCTIRDISLKGALLEFDGIAPYANRFRLIVDHKAFDIECDVRHRRSNALGVLFRMLERPMPAQLPQDGKQLAQGMRYLLSGE